MNNFAICGVKRSGKDTVADYLVSKGYAKIEIARPLKDAAKIIFGLNDDQIDGNSKETADKDLENLFGVGTTPRSLLQVFGTEMMQYEFGKHYPRVGRDIWVQEAIRRIREANSRNVPVVISDLRFLNEARRLKQEMNIKIIKVRNSKAETLCDLHASELEWQTIDATWEIWNDDSKEALLEKINQMI